MEHCNQEAIGEHRRDASLPQGRTFFLIQILYPHYYLTSSDPKLKSQNFGACWTSGYLRNCKSLVLSKSFLLWLRNARCQADGGVGVWMQARSLKWEILTPLWRQGTAWCHEHFCPCRLFESPHAAPARLTLSDCFYLCW